MDNQLFENALKEILSFDTIIIHRHKKPDGDAYGSQLGLYYIIKDNYPQKNVYIVGDSNERLSFMLGTTNMDNIPNSFYTNALVVILDTSSEDLISDERYKLAKHSLRFDHHIMKEKICDIEVVNSSYESCAGLITDFARACNLNVPNIAAQALFTGIVTDSGRFRYDSTSSRTFDTVAFLMQHQIDTETIYKNLYSNDLSFLQMKANFILNIKTTQHNVAYIYTTKDELAQYSIVAQTATRAFVSTMADLKNIDIWASFAEDDNSVSCEIRSNEFNINPIAVKYGGGGHAKASGATVATHSLAMSMLKDLDDLAATALVAVKKENR